MTLPKIHGSSDRSAGGPTDASEDIIEGLSLGKSVVVAAADDIPPEGRRIERT